MNQASILIPVVALAMWTLTVLLLIPYKRFRSVFRQEVAADDFKYGESSRVPEEVSIPNRNYMNLLELPVLFYVACVVIYTTGTVGQTVLTLAWAYVAIRIIHSLVHLTYNNVIHRLTLFGISNIALVVLWVMIFLSLPKA